MSIDSSFLKFRGDWPGRYTRLAKVEIICWWVGGALLTAMYLREYLPRGAPLVDVLLYFAFSANGGIAIAMALVPTVFIYIFELPPLTFALLLRRTRAHDRSESGQEPPSDTYRVVEENSIGAQKESGTPTAESEKTDHVSPPAVSAGRLQTSTMETRLMRQLDRSLDLARRALSRANLHLFSGTVVGLLGLVAFFGWESTQGASVSLEGVEGWDYLVWRLLLSLPRIAILIFVELLATFLLRQYRAGLDEYKYFEAIVRSREDLLNLHTLTWGDDSWEVRSRLLDSISVHRHLAPESIHPDSGKELFDKLKELLDLLQSLKGVAK